jgi:hypothetical protein
MYVPAGGIADSRPGEALPNLPSVGPASCHAEMSVAHFLRRWGTQGRQIRNG